MATKPLEDFEESVEDIPRLVNMRFEYVRAQLDLAVEAKVDAIPRVICRNAR